MRNIIDIITADMQKAFAAAGYDESYGQVTVSNRPDLCEYQCNGALPAAKKYKCAPIVIAKAVVEHLDPDAYSLAEAVMPGFINLKVSNHFLADYLEKMRITPAFGLEQIGTGKTVVVDYGGANAAKPLHIGHLRSAIIGEAIKRLYTYFGYNAIGDVHLGDWGLQMGLIITEMQERQPELCYFDPDYTGEYPEEAPFTMSELEEIYPCASIKKKEDPAFADKAHTATFELQQGRRGYRALWKHILNLSVTDLKKNYDNLNVHFEKWLGESDADPYIPDMIQDLKDRGFAVMSEGAIVVPVSEEGDKKEIPPCILVKSDGSSLYGTTDLATLIQRMQDFKPDKVVYVTDNRQSLHFEQVFRVAKKTGIVGENVELEHIGFGTMNGKDGKPFKTRDGGVMRLETLISDMTDFVLDRVEKSNFSEDEVRDTASKIALAALKYGDLWNQPSKNYVFDMDRFASFEGNTGPYILYTIVRIKSILGKYGEYKNLPIQEPTSSYAKDVMLSLTKFSTALENALKASSPSLICAYVYELAGFTNKFYHETKILSEENEDVKAGYIALIGLTKSVMEACIDILGFEAPDRM
ncbi:MAG: arginine--tRNA ligase [Eubacteriales bacterium]|nr:arginine--tRNA ligase [Eubacteriales bacterium]